MSYSTLLLDLDNTILSFDQAEQYALRKVLEQHAIEWQQELFTMYHNKNKALWLALEQGKVERDYVLSQRFVELFQQLDLEVDGKAMDQMFRSFLTEEIFFMPNAKKVLDQLKKEKQLYVVTNGVAVTQKKRIQKAGLEAYFNEIFISEEIGYQKPSPLFFKHVLGSIEEKDLQDILMIGDSLSADILGGNQVGIDTCWYSNEKVGKKIQPTYHIQQLDELIMLVN
ncbi:YjjG family noncanonical pyrimidine nucleotidase [Vagococcus xieshaowenii]|uniref:Noncanonical pyrimidine nucleotidase, YjjG family n=1 Tax=Vagococcus xieshaowenii TaxID=2562451 RepID=A0A4Z0D7R9_9ENTE|nr:YjjG family noncanonical pyrimidine nucleotidase [Vagococcus xieshaowenii]QCA29107.1 noncanonical pyrimidine nucleotidase, YjjG family [Vagococcus xieshaowenii]TFZ40917.1 noncanonical pyrimidine nucleotidase, YjjG family [Vagococcus xieshaowenii]